MAGNDVALRSLIVWPQPKAAFLQQRHPQAKQDNQRDGGLVVSAIEVCGNPGKTHPGCPCLQRACAWPRQRRSQTAAEIVTRAILTRDLRLLQPRSMPIRCVAHLCPGLPDHHRANRGPRKKRSREAVLTPSTKLPFRFVLGCGRVEESYPLP